MAKKNTVTTFTYGTFESGNINIAANNKIIRLFQQENPNIKVLLRNYQNATQHLTEFAAGNEPDVMFFHYFQLGTYIENGSLLPLNAHVSKDELNGFFESVINGLTFDGELYALPVQTGYSVLYYNKNVFNKYGLPLPNENMTIDSFLNSATKATSVNRKQVNESTFGVSDISIGTFLSLNGVSCFEYGKESFHVYDIDLPTHVKNTLYYNKVKGISPRAFGQENTVGALQGAGNTTFEMGNIAYNFGAAWALRNYKGNPNIDFDITLPPKKNDGNRAPVSAAAMCNVVSAKSKNIDAAVKFLKFYSSPKGLSVTAALPNGVSPRRDVLRSSITTNAFAPINPSVFYSLMGNAIVPQLKWTKYEEYNNKVYKPHLHEATQLGPEKDFNAIIQNYIKELKLAFPGAEIK